MSYIFESFKDWQKKVNENKIKVENTIDQTMTIKVINSNKFTVKARWGGDVVDAMGNLTQTGWNRIVEEIRRSGLSKSLPGMNDFTTYVAKYRVIKDTDTAKDDRQNIKKQFFEFDLVGRPKGLPANIEYALDNEIAGLIQQGGGSLTQSTNTKQGEILGSTSNKKGNTFGLNFSKGAVQMTNLTDPKLVALIDSLYFKVTMDDSLAGNPQVKATMQGVKNELKAATLGDNSKTLISALNAAFSISTRYGDPETGVTQTLVNSVAGVKGKDEEGVALSEVEGFNMGAFLAGLKPISDIKVPAGGFVKGKVVKDNEFAKFQKLLIAKFQKSLGNTQVYKKFAKFDIGGADGTYGTNTANLVSALKTALIDPKWTGNMDPNNVDQAFVDRINQEKVAESYIGLDGFTIITEGLDMGAFQSAPVVSSSSNKGSNGTNNGGDSAGNTKGKLDRKYIDTKPDYAYFVKDRVWHWEKGGKSDILLNTKSIKQLINDNPESGGHYIDIGLKDGKTARTSNNLYKLENGIWKVSVQGKGDFQKATDTSSLDSTYGSVSNTSQEKPMTEKEIDAMHVKVAKKIKSWFPGKFQGPRFKGANDNEAAAWKEFVNMWNGTSQDSVKNMLARTDKAIKALGSGDVKTRLTKNQGHLIGIKNKDTSAAYSFKQMFFNNKTFTIRLRLGSGESWPLQIDTDF